MDTVCQLNMCSGCAACVETCPKSAISIQDSLKAYNAVIDLTRCIGCDRCHQVCPMNQVPLMNSPKQWFQGWSCNEENRRKSSSGGLAYEIEREFLRNGGHVWSCSFFEGEFNFREVQNIEDLALFSGSKYVKSNPMGIYTKICEQLETEKVLFVGLPCQVAGLLNYVGKDHTENLYTVDLICHGTPSPNLLNLFLLQYGYDLKKISEISFRDKNNFRIENNSKYLAVKGTCDCYTQAFLEGLTYTESCYLCPYAQNDRVSDITIGDSWGTELLTDEQGKGISIALIQSGKGFALTEGLPIEKHPVDIERAKAANHQLVSPSLRCPGREKFFRLIKKSSFNSAVRKCIPVKWSKQLIKGILIRCRILRGGKINYSIKLRE